MRKAAEETGAFVTAEEHLLSGGMGSAVAEYLVQHKPVPVEMVGLDNTFGRSGEAKELFEYYKLTPKDIVEKAKKVLLRK